MESCNICEAKFGIKFKSHVCSKCKRTFCEGHIITKKLYSALRQYMYLYDQDGVCYQCLLSLYEMTDNDVVPAKGVLGRTKKFISGTHRGIFRSNPRLLVRVHNSSFPEIIFKKSYGIFKHDRNVPIDFLTKDLGLLARVYAINMGLRNEKEISLKDIYRVIDWIRDNHKIPGFLNNITWHGVERFSLAADSVSDAWHITKGVIALANPAVGFPWAAYHLTDRAVDQRYGKGLVGFALSKIGLDLKPKLAFCYWIAGNVMLKLYEKE